MPAKNEGGTPVVASTSVGIEFGGAVEANTLSLMEHLSVTRVDIPVQIEWLDRVEEVLRKLRPQVEAALINNAEAELRVVRADPSSSQTSNRLIVTIGKIAERLALNASNEAMHEAIHQLFKLLF